MVEKEAGRVIGDAKCHVCDAPIKVRITKKNKLYANCHEASGGCGAQVFSRSATADKHLAKRIERWMDANERRAYLGADDLPVKARPAPAPAPAPEPEPEPEPDDPELEPETAPVSAPPVASPKPKAKRPVPPQFKRAAEADDKEWWTR